MVSYQIVSAYNTGLALDVAWASRSDGANVQVHTRNWSTAQTFDFYDTGDGYRITSTYLGKSIDVDSTTPSQADNVQMWTENDSRLQRWDLVATGETITVDGSTLPLYFVKCHDTEFLMECYGTEPTSGTNIVIALADGDGLADQKWAFVPVPTVVSGGIYEIIPIYSPKLRLDVSGIGKANGTNVFSHSANGGNNQKFYLVQMSDGWAIRDISSGKYIDVSGAVFEDGTNVQIWEDNGTRAQRWSVTSLGTTTIDGVTCEVVSFGADNGSAYMMDVLGAGRAECTNVQIYQANDTEAQKFALLPTQAVDANMPVPTDIGLSTMGGDGNKTVPDGTWYVTWRCSDAWATPGSNSYRFRLRTRYMPSVGSSWGAWGEWTSWKTAPVYISGNRVWLVEPIDGNLDVDDYKTMQVQFQVASQGVKDTRNVWGNSADELLTIAYEPNVVITSATLTANGIEFAYTSDYPYGAMKAHVDTLSFDGTEALALKSTYRLDGQNGTFTIPFDALRSLPADGDTAALGFHIGSDVYSRFPTQHNALPSVSVGTGTVSVTPTISNGDNLTETATSPMNGGRMFMVTDSGMFELDGDPDFTVPYPFGSSYKLVTVYSDGTDWGIDVTERPAKNVRTAHALTWDGGSAVIWLRDGSTLEEERSVAAQHEERFLLNRRHSSVTYQGQTQVEGSIEGAVDVRGLSDPYGTTRYTIESALEAGFCLYRSPFGRVAEVALTKYSMTMTRAFADVSIDYIEVTR